MALFGAYLSARFLTLALTLLVFALSAAPALADHNHGGWDDEAAWDQDDGWDPSAGDAEEQLPAEETTAPLEVDPELAELPADLELEAEPWTPPVTSSPAPSAPSIPIPKAKVIPGKRAYVRRDGKAAIPRGAPKRVRQAIAAANKIIGKPYVWGGGHARLIDRGYDCSGAVGFSLIHAALQRAPMVSGQYASGWGRRGNGRWITVYANRGHVYMEIAGLRLDTSPVGDPTARRGTRWRPVIGRRGGFVAKHPAGL